VRVTLFVRVWVAIFRVLEDVLAVSEVPFEGVMMTFEVVRHGFCCWSSKSESSSSSRGSQLLSLSYVCMYVCMYACKFT
jgi:hypothetical protein